MINGVSWSSDFAAEAGPAGGGLGPEGEVCPVQPHDREVPRGPHWAAGAEAEGRSSLGAAEPEPTGAAPAGDQHPSGSGLMHSTALHGTKKTVSMLKENTGKLFSTVLVFFFLCLISNDASSDSQRKFSWEKGCE